MVCFTNHRRGRSTILVLFHMIVCLAVGLFISLPVCPSAHGAPVYLFIRCHLLTWMVLCEEVYVYMFGRMRGDSGGRSDGRTDVRTDDDRTDGRMNKRTAGRTVGRTNGRTDHSDTLLTNR